MCDGGIMKSLTNLIVIISFFLFSSCFVNDVFEDDEDTDIETESTEQDTSLTEIEDAWKSSAHADATAEAFIHWDEDGKIPTTCAKCHSTPGFRDFIGADSSAAGTVDAEAETGTVITCKACHNDKTTSLSTVKFPSEIELTGLGNESICMSCHQGRESTISVYKAITDAAATDDDAVNTTLSFINIHYAAAGA